MSVYFAQRRQRGLIKIGWSRSVETRLRMVKAKLLLGAVPGGRSVETEIHDRFAHLRVRGEWFKPAKELLDYTSSIRLPKSFVTRIDAVVSAMSQPGVFVSRAAVMRLAMHRGIVELETQYIKGKRRSRS